MLAMMGEMKELFLRHTAVFALVVLLVALVVGGCRGPSGPTGIPPTTAFQETSATIASADGLSLTLSLDSTNYHPGDQVTVTIDEYNTSVTENKVDAADKWPVKGLSLGP